MKKVFKFLGILCLFGCIVGCSSELSEQKYSDTTGTIVFNSENRYIDATEIKTANVKVYGYDMETISASNVNVSGGKGTYTIDAVPIGKNRIIEVSGYKDSEKSVPVKILYKTLDISSGSNPVGTITDGSDSAKGKAYLSLLNAGVNITDVDLGDFSGVSSAYLFDAESFASAYKSNSSVKPSSYIQTVGSVNFTNISNATGYTIWIDDPLSSKVSLSGSETSASATGVAPGTWNVYVNDTSSTKVVGSVTVKSGAKATYSDLIGEQNTTFDGIKILVAKSLNYPMIHYWSCSDTTNYPNTTWPGVDMDSTLSDDDYVYLFNGVSSVSLLITNSNKAKLCSSDVVLTEKGTYRITSSGASKQTEPTPPSVTVSAKAYIGGTFTITVTSDTSLTSNTVSIGGSSKTLSIGTNSFNVSDFTSSATTLAVSGTLSNSAGSTAVSSSVVVSEKPATTLVTDWNELRIYQVMVSAFQDGDSSIGFTNAYGPSDALKGGDLQGIINALDYIKDLGCNALWMTPIFNSNGDGALDSTGYFAYDYFNIDPHFGTMSKFDELVEKCHEKGINVILDGVFGHNKGYVASSPNRNGIKNPGITPDTNNPVNYATNANSLKFYSDVARYWITEHKIDGWRFDQCYQLANGEYNKKTNCNTGGHNYWYDIRKVVNEAASSNGTLGQDWGTLGYMVGEDWDGNAATLQASVVDPLNSNGFGLQSCFDFPAYYQVVQGFAMEWGGTTSGSITTGLSYLYKTYSEKGYSCKEDDGTYKTYYPNFMLSNHDLYRIGDLINKKYSEGYESDNYAKRNMVILAAQAAYSGPITIYYGDEIGDHSTDKSGWYADNVARSSGKISGFSSREQKIHDWTQKCLAARAEHKALWSGTNTQIKGTSDFYVAKKVCDGETIYIAFNYNSSSSKTFSASGTDLISGQTFSGTVTVPALSAMYILAN